MLGIEDAGEAGGDGGAFVDGEVVGSDFQAPYLRDWLAWAGVDDVGEIAFRPNLVTADASSGREAAHARARDLGKTF